MNTHLSLALTCRRIERKIRLISFSILALIAAACAPQTAVEPNASPAPVPQEVAVTQLPLQGPLSEAKAEVSGMAWFGDHLILLPQYPKGKRARDDGAIYSLPKQDILDCIDGKTSCTLVPRAIRFDSDGLESTIAGFEGYEAIAFHGNTAYLTIEAGLFGRMSSYLVRGELSDDLTLLRLDKGQIVKVPLDVQISNFSNEALLIYNDHVVLFYEANGAAAYPDSRARVYNLDLEEITSLDVPPLEYRLTDVTQPDDQGRFWASNFFFPMDVKILPKVDPLAEKWGKGPTHAQTIVVERLVELQLPDELQIENGGIALIDAPPVQLVLAEGYIPRNWEGIARLDERGLLLATDTFPGTILAFVPSDF